MKQFQIVKEKYQGAEWFINAIKENGDVVISATGNGVRPNSDMETISKNALKKEFILTDKFFSPKNELKSLLNKLRGLN